MTRNHRVMLCCAVTACLVACCGADLVPGGSSSAKSTTDADAVASRPTPLPEVWPELQPVAEPTRTADGIPILDLPAAQQRRTGDVVWLHASDDTLQWPRYEASDGKQVYFAIRDDAGRQSDMLVRGDQVYTDVLQSLAAGDGHPGGCAAARDGALLLSTTVPDEDRKRGEQVIWRLPADGGPMRRLDTPVTFAGDDECRAWLADDGTFALGLFGIVTWDGSQLTEDRGWYNGRTVMGRPGGPRYCFDYCNAAEAQNTDPATAALKRELSGQATWIAMDHWIAGVSRQGGKAVRMREGGAMEVLTDIPDSATSFGQYAALTDRGDLVIALDYHYRSYVVWPAGGGPLSPVRFLADGERLANASPTILLHGLPDVVPDCTAAGIRLGADIGFGSNGPTYVYSPDPRSTEAYQAQLDRAAAVLSGNDLWVVREAVVDRACGAYVRSPLGWEAEMISDWVPPTLPALHAEAVTQPDECTPLEHVTAVPGALDLLLGLTKQGDLLAAWLPPPLPLPSGISHWDQEPPRPPPPQEPKPGTGWSTVGKVSAVDGVLGEEAPGGRKQHDLDGWQYGGGALITTQDRTPILLTGWGAMTLPPDTTPMSVDPYAKGAWGARRHELVVCKDTCRVLDPGVDAAITSVVPRTADQVLLGYADGRVGLYTVPAVGGVAVEPHPMQQPIEDLLSRRPRP